MIQSSVLLTDLYQLTMLQAYFDQGMRQTAVFEFFVRKLPPARNFLIAAGLEQLTDFLEELRFTAAELDWLQRSGRFRQDFIDSLADLRFTGDVDAMPEGTVFFQNEPIVRVMAPIREAQLIETRLINILHFETLIASKAARCVLVAPDKLLVDFGLRRAHGAEAGLLAARASYLAGFSGTATVLAEKLYGIPLYGTMAHSFIQAHEREADAFEHFARSHPNNCLLLIDTYDTEAAAAKLIPLAVKLRQDGIAIRGVRIDSGDLGKHARAVRDILDGAGLTQIRIFASGNLDEYEVEALLKQGAPIDGFGIGTHLDTSADRPYLDCAYKLQEYAGRSTRKRSEGKATWPGRKQIYRLFDNEGKMAEDIITLQDAPALAGTALLRPCMRGGKRLANLPNLDLARVHAKQQLAALPEALKSLEPAPAYAVTYSPELCNLRDKLEAQASHV
jgi:nicotinate phosphoribosyltransferase